MLQKSVPILFVPFHFAFDYHQGEAVEYFFVLFFVASHFSVLPSLILLPQKKEKHY